MGSWAGNWGNVEHLVVCHVGTTGRGAEACSCHAMPKRYTCSTTKKALRTAEGLHIVFFKLALLVVCQLNYISISSFDWHWAEWRVRGVTVPHPAHDGRHARNTGAFERAAALAQSCSKFPPDLCVDFW